MQIKCIALDLDGTTLRDDKTLSPETKQAIEAAIAKGVHIVIASGRCFDSLPAAVCGIPGIQYAITSNGAAVYDMAGGRCIKNYPLPESAAERIIKLLPSDGGYALEVFYEGKAYAQKDYIANPCAFGASEIAVNYIRSTRNGVDNILTFIQDHKNQLDGIDIILSDRKIWESLYSSLQQMKDELYVTSSVQNRVEITSCQSGKHTGLEYILSLIHADASETAAFGNADNDVEMLQSVRYGMAVKNASKSCLDAAWKIVPGNQEDGVARGIEELLDD